MGRVSVRALFPDINSAQIQYRIAPSFLLDTGSCIVFGRQHHDARHYVLVIRNLQVSCSSSSWYSIRGYLTVLFVFCLMCGTGTSSVENKQ